MRITCKVAAAMKCGIYRHPMPKWDIESCYHEDGSDKMDEGKLMRALDVSGITFSSGDNGPVALMVNEFLQALERIIKIQNEKLSEDLTSTEKDERLFNKGLDKCVKKIDDDSNVCYVRFTVEWVNGHVRFKIGRDNPHDVKGQAWKYSWVFCVDAMRILLHMQKRFLDNTCTVVDVEESDNCEGLIAESRKQNEWFEERDKAQALVDEMMNKRESCPHRQFDRCVPLEDGTAANCKCCLYCSGACRIPALPAEFENPPEF